MKKSVKNYLNKGIEEYAAGNHEESRKAFTKAIELDPNNARAYYNRGMVGFNGGFSFEVMEDFEKALELDPNFSDAYYAMARYHAQDGCPPDEDIIRMMNKYVELRPNDPWAYHERAFTFFLAGQYDNAIKDLSIAIDMNPEEIDDYYHERGRAYVELEKYEDAILNFNRSIDINPKNSMSYYYRGHSYGNLQKIDLAIQDLTTAIEMDEKLIEAYLDRGICYFSMGKYHDAIEDFNMIEKLDAYFGGKNPYRGYCYNKIGEHRLAIKDLNAAIWDNYQTSKWFCRKDFQARGESYRALGYCSECDRDRKAAEFLSHLEKTTPEKIRELKYDHSTETIIVDDAA